jgi:Zn-dependent membrane protease YugP
MRLLQTRTKLARAAMVIDLAVTVVMVAAPLVMLATRSPYGFVIDIVIGVLLMTMNVLLQIVTLPVEIDASFNRALPLLRIGRYLPDYDMPAARQILAAAAFTYVAAALMSMLNIGRWFRGLRI